MFLHAHSVSFDWPEGIKGGSFSASAPLPAELAGVHRRTRFRARADDARQGRR